MTEWQDDSQEKTICPPIFDFGGIKIVTFKNESNIFSVDRGINQIRMENCINTGSALFQEFSSPLLIDTSINQ